MIDSSLRTIPFDMQRLKSEHGFSWSAADRVLVLHEGHIVEAGVADEVGRTSGVCLYAQPSRREPVAQLRPALARTRFGHARRLVDRLDHPISGYQLEPVEKVAVRHFD